MNSLFLPTELFQLFYFNFIYSKIFDKIFTVTEKKSDNDISEKKSFIKIQKSFFSLKKFIITLYLYSLRSSALNFLDNSCK